VINVLIGESGGSRSCTSGGSCASDALPYSREQLAWRDEVRRFLQKAVTPALVAEMRQRATRATGRWRAPFHRRCSRALVAVGWPKEFGGLASPPSSSTSSSTR